MTINGALAGLVAITAEPLLPSAGMASFIVLLVIKAVMGIRVSEEEEAEGMDLHECGMHAYPEFAPEHVNK